VVESLETEGTRPCSRPSSGATCRKTVVEEPGRISFAGHSLQSLVQRVADVAAQVVPGEPVISVISVTVVTDGRPRTLAASGPPAVDLDDTQYRLGGGRCLSAARGFCRCPSRSRNWWPAG
jgi:hypothetical protein